MSRPRKFRPGHQITDLGELIHAINVGCWIYWPNQDRPRHPSFMLSQRVMTLRGAVMRGHVWIAVPTEHFKEAAE